MTPIQSARVVSALALALTAALASAGRAGEGAVAPDPTVFLPPSHVFVPPAAQQPLPGGTVFEPGTEDVTTFAAVSGFEEALALCNRVPDPAYQIDCLADQLEQLAENLPQTPEFAEVRANVQAASQRLEQVVRRNVSTTKRPARLRQDTPTAPKRSRRPIVPVADDRLAQATAEAVTILRETETILLRAAEQSERRKVAFTQVAQAVGSASTILLRSR